MEQFGTCKYCRNVVMVECPEDSSQEERDEKASINCKCDGAIISARKKHEIVKARERIEQLFGETSADLGLEPIRTEKIHDLLNESVDMLANDKIRSISVDIDANTKAKLSVNAKGRIAVSRNQAITYKLEA